MIVPVGERYQPNPLFDAQERGKLEEAALRPTLFVPMTGAAEEKREVKADPANPVLVNGNFEEPLINQEHVPDGIINLACALPLRPMLPMVLSTLNSKTMFLVAPPSCFKGCL